MKAAGLADVSARNSTPAQGDPLWLAIGRTIIPQQEV
jgi:hypothetical protein